MKTYLNVVKLVFMTSRIRFVCIIGLSVLVGIIEGLLVQLNIMVLSAIQDILSGSTAYWKLIVVFVVYYFLAPNFYVHLPMQNYLKALLSQKLKLTMYHTVFEKAYRIDMLQYENPSTYDNINKASENITSERFMNVVDSMIKIPVFVSAVVTIITILNAYNPFLIVLASSSMLPVFLSKYLQGRRFFALKNAQEGKKRFLGYLWSLFIERNSNRDMRTFHSFSYLNSKHQMKLDEIVDENWQYEKRTFFTDALLNITKPLGFAAGLLISAYMTYKGQISLAVFSSISGALSAVQEHTEGLIDICSETLKHIPFIRHYYKFIQMEEELKGGILLDSIESVEFRNVHFKYPSNSFETLKGVSFYIQKNESISLLGYNGAGKSTIVKLICGFYKPSKGKIYINGIPYADLNQSHLWNQMSVVFQDYLKYEMTLYENIGFEKAQKASEKEDILRFLNNQDGYGFIHALPSGMDTVLGRELGETELSGGQWQKVAIARGQYRDFSLIILDEPTAALDPLAESDVYHKFKQMTKDSTSFIISHRIGSASIADRILVLKDGIISESGSHEELMQLDGDYKELYEMQAQWYVQ